MKLASYNVENLFLRARVMNQDSWDDGRAVLKLHAELNALLGEETYTPAMKKRIVELLVELDLEKRDEGPFVLLRQNHAHLVKRPKGGGLEVVADGRGDWIGWLELKVEAVNEVATRMTAKVIEDVGADVLGIVEAESRPALVRFSESLLPLVAGTSYDHVMLIDGNDERGIDVGIMTRQGYEIRSMRSHVDDADATVRIFSRDCAEYELVTPKGNLVTVLVNHFKSKGYGSQASSNKKRLRQAERVKEIYDGLVAAKKKHIAVIGDFNDTPDSAPLAPLLANTDLQDVSAHGNFDDGGRPGTYGSCSPSSKIDFILLSPSMFAATKAGGIFREGVWGGKNGTIFPHYPEITKASEAASDHAAIWAEIDL